MQRISSFVGLASGVRVANVWLLTSSSGERVLVDTGHPVERVRLRFHLWRAGCRRPGDLAAIVLTHRHGDHAGNATWLRNHFQAPVICHQAEAACLSGDVRPAKLSRPTTRGIHKLLCQIEDFVPATCPVDDVFEDGPWKWGFRVFHVPGHTEGSVLLHHEPSGTLFSGDSILTGPPVVRSIENIRYAYSHYSQDIESCVRTVREAIAALPQTALICAGHGPPVAEGAQSKLQALADHGEID